MDRMDLTIGSTSDRSDIGPRWSAEQLHSLAGQSPIAVTSFSVDVPAPVPEPASQEEIDAILAAVPRGCRNAAAWAVPLLIDTARNGGIKHPRRIAYLLATAHHASNFGKQLVEANPTPPGAGADRFFDRYEPGTPLGAARGNTAPGDGERFRGRGFVHVAGRASYAAWSRRLGMPDRSVDGQAVPFLIAHPEAMARPHVAAQTLVRGMRDGIFTGIALGYYVNDKKTDYFNARRVIDGTSQAREVAALAVVYQNAIEKVAAERHRAQMQQLADQRAAADATRDLLQEVRDAIERLSSRGEIMVHPTQVADWNGEARQGKFVQLDERTCALHMGRGVYVRLDIQRDLNGVVPPEGKNMALKRTGEVRPALRDGEAAFWR